MKRLHSIFITLFILLVATHTTMGQVTYFRYPIAIAPANLSLPTPAGYNLYVVGGILTERVRVASRSSSNWADYVFAPTYRLRPLGEVERYIQQYRHLPDVPSASQVKQDGIDLADNQRVLLQKIEELTLYAIRQEKEMDRLRQEVQQLKASRKSHR